MMHFKKTLTAIVIGFVLTACGSDEVSKSEILSPDFSSSNVSLQSSIEMDELNSVPVTISTNYTGDKKLAYSLGEYDTTVVTASVNNNVITLQAADLTESEIKSTDIAVSITDGVTTRIESLTVTVTNTSYRNTIQEADDYYILGTDILSLNHESIIYTWALDMGYLDQKLSYDDIDYFKNLYEQGVVASRITLEGFLNEDLKKIRTLAVSDVEQVDISSISKDFNNAVSSYSNAVSKAFDLINEQDISGVPEIKFDSLSNVNGVASFFYGNRNMGSYGKDDQWVFVKPFEKFEKLIPLSGDVCRISDNTED